MIQNIFILSIFNFILKHKMREHIELNRTLRSLTDDEISEIHETYLELYSDSETKTWDDVSQYKRVVILAEAGTGKTHEFRAIAQRLHKKNKISFFIPIEDLAEDGLVDSLTDEDQYKFYNWEKSNTDAWFLLDSVDEARLINANFFKKALKKLAKILNKNLSRAHIIISARVSEWRPKSDKELVSKILPIPRSQNPTNIDSTKDSEQLKIFQLTPLTREQQQIFVKNNGIDTNKFIDAIDKANVEIYARRPQDLLDLIIYWKNNGKIGSHSEMLDFNIKTKLKEHNQDKAENSQISGEQLVNGAKILATALTLIKNNNIALPEYSKTTGRSSNHIYADEILTDWSNTDIKTLLDRPLFDEATYGRVKFHHRSVREYLTALWFVDLLNSGTSHLHIQKILFGNKYETYVVRPSMRAISAWIALENKKIRDKLFQIAPEILLAEGDASKLPINFRSALLNNYIKLSEGRDYLGHNFDKSSIKRIASPALADQINKHLLNKSIPRDIKHLLLEMIWVGEIENCADLALSFAKDSSNEDLTRIHAFNAVGVVSSSKQKKILANSILKECANLNHNLIGAALENLFPYHISVDELIHILQSTYTPKEFSHSRLHSYFHFIENYNLPPKIRENICSKFLTLIRQKPYIDKYCQISKNYSWIFDFAMAVAEIDLNKNIDNPHRITDGVLCIFELYYVTRDYHQFNHNLAQKTSQHLSSNTELRQIFYWRNIKQASANKRQPHPFNIRIPGWGLMTENDLPAFLEILKNEPIDLGKIALNAAIQIWIDCQKKDSILQTIRQAISSKELSSILHTRIEEIAKKEAEYKLAEEDSAFKKKQRKINNERTANFNKFVSRLQANPEKLYSITADNLEETFPDLLHLGNSICSKSNSHNYSAIDWELLIKDFGTSVAKATRNGLVKFWRLYTPDLWSENSEHPRTNGNIAGLYGLSIEASETPQWAQKLKPSDAIIAAHYIPFDLNGFPFWGIQLLQEHPNAVDSVIIPKLEWEFKNKSTSIEHPRTLSSIRYGAKNYWDKYHQVILSLLNKYGAVGYTLEYAIDIILQSKNVDKDLFSTIAEKHYSKKNDPKANLTWLIALMCTNANSALRKLKKWLNEAPSSTDSDSRMLNFLSAFYPHHNIRFHSIHIDFNKPSILKELALLSFNHIRVEEDRIREGVFTPTSRDDAEHTRGVFLRYLFDIEGDESFKMLKDLSHELPHKNTRDYVKKLLKDKSETESEHTPWSVKEFKQFQKTKTKTPKSNHELFVVTIEKLEEVKDDLENGEHSEATVYKGVNEETVLRNSYAKCLERLACGLYSTSQEDEDAAQKRTDIHIHNPNISSAIPIELKIADKWTGTKLFERLANQLVGQYMRNAESNYGIFLLSYKGDKLYWKSPEGENLDFSKLILKLQEYANKIIEREEKCDEVKIVGIDLTKREQNKIIV
ncbi:hypothetical protein D0S45_00390 [Marinifilum sp. JC120]|nr:hypothetical protein D0S45_00390 [Marinifilum sp. JC120]